MRIKYSDLGRACLLETGCKSGWWARCRYICNTFGLKDRVNITWFADISVNGVDQIGMSVNFKKHGGSLQMRKSSSLVIEYG